MHNKRNRKNPKNRRLCGMNKEEINSMLNDLKQDLDIKEKIKVEVKPMKIKAASISLNKNTIRLNKNLLPQLEPQCIKYLILHELLHLKLKNIHHNNHFYEILYNKVDKEQLSEIERKIFASLLKLNGILL
ncbi:MAG: YgjP-like metallopeptidase domain-containing protein [Nitrososphaerota archaeon]